MESVLKSFISIEMFWRLHVVQMERFVSAWKVVGSAFYVSIIYYPLIRNNKIYNLNVTKPRMNILDSYGSNS